MSEFMLPLHYLYPTTKLMIDIYEQIFFEKKVPIFQKHIVEDLELYKKLYKVFQAHILKKEEMILETYIIDALSYLIKNYSTCTNSLDDYFNNSKLIKRSLELINDCIYDDISLDTLSSNVNLSKYHYLRIFKKELGLTPHQYILNKKVENAISLIQKGHTIIDAALEVGFNDQSHFNRTFKKYYDYLPTHILNNHNFILNK